MISGPSLAAAKRALGSVFESSAQVIRRSVVSGTQGPQWGDVSATEVRCNVEHQTGSGREERLDTSRPMLAARFFFPAGTDVVVSDELEWGGRRWGISAVHLRSTPEFAVIVDAEAPA